jgi:two-component system phosphate regulon sensor histidine kinase PhoR
LFALMLLALGAGCFLYPVFGPPTGIDAQLLNWLGAVMLFLSATSGQFSLTVHRRSYASLQKQIISHVESEKGLNVIESNNGPALPLVHAINELVQYADRAVRDTTSELKEMQLQLKVATSDRRHAEAILHSISDAVLVTDQFDDLLLANETAARTLGFDLQTSGRKPLGSVIDDKSMVQMIQDMRKRGTRTGRRVVEHHVKTKAGLRSFKLTLSSVADRDDGPTGVVAVLNDITREKEVAAMKNDFVSNVSHELRTPLASIKAYVEMLIDGEAESEQTKTEFYEIIQNEANRLGRLIDNILNISRIESGLVKVNKTPQSLTVIAKEALEVIAPQAKLKNIQIIEQLTPVFYQTLADRDMLYQAILNLLSNAVKYTKEGGSVTVQAVIDETERKVITRIKDTGVGIPPKDLPYVFDKFYRVEANKAVAKGTGLGLSLVKQIIENVHQGRILVRSEVGQGTEFTFELSLCE